MQVLEKILEKIEKEFDKRIGTQLGIIAGIENEVYRYGYAKSLDAYQQSKLLITDIIRSHMEDESVSNPNKLDNGWIPISSGKLPEEKTNPITYDFEEYEVTFQSDNVRDIRHYKFGRGHWWHGPAIVDKYVTAWRPRPEPYQEKED